VIDPSQRPLRDNIKYSQKTGINNPAGFEPAIPASKRPQTHALDFEATRIGLLSLATQIKSVSKLQLAIDHAEHRKPIEVKGTLLVRAYYDYLGTVSLAPVCIVKLSFT
jgi:hypothetical protein